MAFLNREDYSTLIDKQALAVLEQTSEENRVRAEQAAQEEITENLSRRYNIEKAFSQEGDDRNRRLMLKLMDIALYHMSSWLPGRMGIAVRKERYELAVKWLEDARAGKLNLNLPLKGDNGQKDYDVSQSSVMEWGSFEKNNNDW